MVRRTSSILFGLILGLSLTFVVWWTFFQAMASGELAAAADALAAMDQTAADAPARVAAAFGVADIAAVHDLAESRYWMFLSEGAVFVLVLLVSGVLFAASVRREATTRQEQDRFLAGATHELKTPLATISLLLESLRDDRLAPEKRAHYLQMGLLETDRLERGLTNVLVAAGLRTTRQSDRRIDGDLAADVRAVLDRVAARAAAAEVAIESHIDGTISVPARRDPEAVQLIVHNLLENAIKYSPRGGKVEMALDIEPAAARITVRDRGRGLDDQELRRAFEPFWRGSDIASGGSGLGLHLVRQLTEAHGGTVECSSAGRDAGAEFVVRLPRQETGK